LFALKILDKRQQITENEVEHVMNESKLLKRLKFPFVVKHYGSFQDDSRLYILMEYVTGSDLFTYIQEYRFDNTLVRFFSSQVVMLLEYLHLQDVVFRDLKPENLLIDWRGYLKLTDFSFAKEIPDQKTYTFCGTPCYMSPEIILQEGHGKAADWWALGILIYEMITGHPPFDKRDSVELYDDILTTAPNFDDRFSETAQNLVQMLLEKDPDRRLGSKGAQEVKDHPFFDEIDWDSIYTRRTKSPLPSHVIDNPVDRTPLDTGFGDPLPLTGEEQKLFVGF
jgi:serine/threonine protein kinase